VSAKYCLLSIPNEPFFMMSSFIRGKNMSRPGNDVDHLQHWSSISFQRFIGRKLKMLRVIRPFPWTVILSTIAT
jgi:hypothetical protein